MQALAMIVLIVLTLKSDHGKWFWGLLLTILMGFNIYNA